MKKWQDGLSVALSVFKVRDGGTRRLTSTVSNIGAAVYGVNAAARSSWVETAPTVPLRRIIVYWH